jgi:hypothetical protein
MMPRASIEPYTLIMVKEHSNKQKNDKKPHMMSIAPFQILYQDEPLKLKIGQ